MPNFRNKPIVIEAIQWNGSNLHEITEFSNGKATRHIAYEGNTPIETDNLSINTLEGKMIATQKDWIIKGVQGEFYPCKPDIFEKTYELVE